MTSQGVWEKDEIRKDDSFRAFEEVLELAVQNNVDFILLAGDLFHENKPSRTTVVKAIELISKHCLYERDHQFELLVKPEDHFVSK